jgi:hypothetical protein
MTPKEKAIELYDKMYSINEYEFISIYASKATALIAVDEMINYLLDSDWALINNKAKYWQEVKQEIQKL